MKKILFTLAFLTAMSLTVTNAQQTIANTENEKIVTHVSGNNYDVVYTTTDGNILQQGHYYKVGERYKPHGVWKLYDRNTFDLITTAKYDKGEQIWVETIIDGKVLHVDHHELEVKRLEERIVALEKRVNNQ
tara:strand:+ start:21843 stop:22238 length:396 start_codon:yes stop_codon:yes gene_type:complete